MGRPQQYRSGAERQRAYRERLDKEMVRVNRRGLDRLEAQLEQLQAAVRAAARAGDATARACTEPSMEGMLAKMTSYFEGKGERSASEGEQEGNSTRRQKN